MCYEALVFFCSEPFRLNKKRKRKLKAKERESENEWFFRWSLNNHLKLCWIVKNSHSIFSADEEKMATKLEIYQIISLLTSFLIIISILIEKTFTIQTWIMIISTEQIHSNHHKTKFYDLNFFDKWKHQKKIRIIAN